MNCREFELTLPRLVRAGVLPGGAGLSEALEHAEHCARCRRLLQIARGDLALQDDDEADVAVQAILQRTSGRACVAAEARLPAWADGQLPPGDADLLAEHLSHCAGCRELAEALVVLREALPELAEADPGPAFTASVVSLTSRAPEALEQGRPRFAASGTGARPFSRRLVRRRPSGRRAIDAIRGLAAVLGDVWSSILHRPRAALELAYGTSFVFFLIAGSPANRLRDVSSEVTALAARVQSPRLISAAVVPENWWDSVTGSLRGAAGKAEEKVPPGFAARLGRTWGRLLATAAALRDHGPAMGRSLLSLDLVGAWKEAEFIRLAGRNSGEPAAPGVRPEDDKGMASPGGAGHGPAATKGGTS